MVRKLIFSLDDMNSESVINNFDLLHIICFSTKHCRCMGRMFVMLLGYCALDNGND